MSATELFLGFGRVGLFGFGGGPSMLPLMQSECVGAGWVTEEDLIESEPEAEEIDVVEDARAAVVNVIEDTSAHS